MPGAPSYKSVFLPAVMVSLLLVQSALPVLWRMDCLVSGRSVLSWGEARSCMPYEANGPCEELDVTCCVFSAASGEQAEFLKEAVPLPIVLPVLFIGHAPKPPSILRTAGPLVLPDHPPPDVGLDLPVRYHQMLI